MFGDLTNRFRITKGQLQMHGGRWEQRLKNIIRAALILHNLCLDFDDEANFTDSGTSSSESEVGFFSLLGRTSHVI